MSKLFIHIGLHKTASSSLQRTCHFNRTKLNKQGLFYPLFACPGTDHKEINNHSIPIFSLYTTHPENYSINVRWKIQDVKAINHAYRQQLDEALGCKEDILLSGEDIASLETHELSRLLTDLRKTGRDIDVFASVRSPYEFHCSQVQQQIKDGVAMNTVGLCPQRHRITKLKKVFGESIQWIPFAKACGHLQGPVGTYLYLCGIEPTRIMIQNSNEGRSAELMRIQNVLNHHQPCIKDGKINPKHIRIKPFKGSKFLLSKSELSEIKDHLNHENAALEKLLGPDFCDIERPTIDSFLKPRFPLITYGLTALIGLKLHQIPDPFNNNLSLQDVHRFLLEDCEEQMVRQVKDIDEHRIIKLLTSPTTVTTKIFPQELINLAQEYISRL